MHLETYLLITSLNSSSIGVNISVFCSLFSGEDVHGVEADIQNNEQPLNDAAPNIEGLFYFKINLWWKFLLICDHYC